MADRYLQTGQLILQDVLGRCNEPTALTGNDVSDYLNDTKALVQRVYYDILEYAPWPWALKDPPGVLTVYAKVTGSATVTKDNAAVTLGATIATSKTGWWFQVDGQQVPYRIVTHTAGTAAITLDAPYNEANGAAVACTLFKDEYALAADCMKIWFAWNRNRPTDRIDIIGRGEMQDRFVTRYHSGPTTRVISVIKGNKVRIRPWPETDNITLEYDYTAQPGADFTFDGQAATDTPVIPLHDRHVLSDAAAVQLMLMKNDPRAQETMNLMNGKLQNMVATYLPAPKQRAYPRRGQGMWR